MSWDSYVFLAKKRIAQKTIDETYRTMQARYGAGYEDEEEDADTFVFSKFRFRLVRDGTAGLRFYITNEDVSSNERDIDEAGQCMSEWAQLLGGELTEEEWNARWEKAEGERVEKRKLPKYGAADTVCYFAFDAAGTERGKKSIAKEVHGHVTPKMLDPDWLVANEVVRIEYVSYGSDGSLYDHLTYRVDKKGNRKRVRD